MKKTDLNGTSQSFAHDAMGNRLSSIDGGRTTHYFVNSVNQYQSITSVTIPPSGARRHDVKGKLLHDGTRAYQWGSKNRLLKVSRQDLCGRAGRDSYRYDAFGNILVTQGEKALENEYRFSTKPLNEVNGLYYYGYRYYDPVTGRWPSRDPIGERGGENFYGFVGNDGVNYSDYLGLIPVSGYSYQDPLSVPFVEDFFGDLSSSQFAWTDFVNPSMIVFVVARGENDESSRDQKACYLKAGISVGPFRVVYNSGALGLDGFEFNDHVSLPNSWSGVIGHELHHIASFQEEVKPFIHIPLTREESCYKTEEKAKIASEELTQSYSNKIADIVDNQIHHILGIPGAEEEAPYSGYEESQPGGDFF